VPCCAPPPELPASNGFCQITAELLRRNGPVPLVELGSLDPNSLLCRRRRHRRVRPMIELPPSGDEPVLAVGRWRTGSAVDSTRWSR